jgi:hypothetical protein
LILRLARPHWADLHSLLCHMSDCRNDIYRPLLQVTQEPLIVVDNMRL